MRDEAEIEELARKIVSHHYGSAPFRVKVEGGGLNNHVATVQHERGTLLSGSGQRIRNWTFL
jgi:hypothetical protein